jgi:glycosyltransferase involved in cell wall biosynthesis
VHILVLTDRDWTHPQGGGTGTHLLGHVQCWLDWGHRVSVIACGYPGSVPREEREGLTVHRIGGRTTVFPRAILRQRTGLVRDADVVLEVINGITFLTPLWLRTPRVALVHHIHRRHYVEEMGAIGRPAAFLLETLPLKALYRRAPFMAVSQATAEEVAAHGIPSERIAVNYNGVDVDHLRPGARAPVPTMLALGRLKRYKRVELVLDALEHLPGVVLELAGEGDHHEELEAEVARRGLTDRVRFHGHVDEATKQRLLQEAWVHVTASAAEGWGLAVAEAAACATPTVAIGVGGLRESVVDGVTGLLANDAEDLTRQIRRLFDDAALRERLGTAARERAEQLSWQRTAARTLELLEAARAEATTPSRPAVRSVAVRPPQAPAEPSGMLVGAVARVPVGELS